MEQTPKGYLIPQRVILALMAFIAIICAYATRGCLSMAIVKMVVKLNTTNSNGDDNEETGGTYEWSQELQGRILSCFFIGYMISHIPAGILTVHFGGKWPLALGILISAIFTILTPATVEYGGPIALIVLRIIMGLGQGVLFPALSALLSQWVPIKERGKLGALVLGGGQAGILLCNTISGLLLDVFEWPIVFYSFGIFTVAWFICFVILCSSDPLSHPFITEHEKQYLLDEMGTIGRRKDLPSTPWKGIFTNGPMLALIFSQCGYDFGFYIMVTDLPKYFADVMGFSIKSNGFFSSLPFIAMWVLSLATGVVCDWLISRNILNITATRRMMSGISLIVSAVFMIGASYAESDRVLVVVLFTCCLGIMGLYYGGIKLSPIDMSPNYSGTLMAIVNGIGSICGFIGAYLVGVLTPNASLLEWRIVFWMTFIIRCVTGTVSCIWISGEVQPFNDPPSQEDTVTKEK